jgi:hypothetical protein
MTRLIGLTGMAGAGKNEAARALTAIGWKEAAFAEKMRTAMLALDPIVTVNPPGHSERLSVFITFYGWDITKRDVPEVRRLLQKFGTEAGREIHGANCWVDALFADWDDSTPLVVTDCRFDNEAQAIRDRGGVVVRIDRPGLDPLPGGHASEAGVTDPLVDWVIYNDRDVAHLHREILAIAEGLG